MEPESFGKHFSSSFHNPISIEDRFLAAVRDGDVDFVEYVLSGCFGDKMMNATDRFDRTPLSVAVRSGKTSKCCEC